MVGVLDFMLLLIVW